MIVAEGLSCQLPTARYRVGPTKEFTITEALLSVVGAFPTCRIRPITTEPSSAAIMAGFRSWFVPGGVWLCWRRDDIRHESCRGWIGFPLFSKLSVWLRRTRSFDSKAFGGILVSLRAVDLA